MAVIFRNWGYLAQFKLFIFKTMYYVCRPDTWVFSQKETLPSPKLKLHTRDDRRMEAPKKNKQINQHLWLNSLLTKLETEKWTQYIYLQSYQQL